MPKNNTLTQIEIDRLRWLRRNRSILQQIANEIGVSHETVRRAYWGHTGTPKPAVTEALRRENAPGFTQEVARV